MKKKLIYIASPYTIGDQFRNVQRQIEAANGILDAGHIPISPLLNAVYYNAQFERSWEFWMQIDFELLDRCDMLLRLDGPSKGADLEVAHAKERSIPVFEYNYCVTAKVITKFVDEI